MYRRKKRSLMVVVVEEDDDEVGTKKNGEGRTCAPVYLTYGELEEKELVAHKVNKSTGHIWPLLMDFEKTRRVTEE